MVIWGISWPTSKILTLYTDTFTLIFLKFFLSVLTLVPLVVVFFKPKNIFNKHILKPLLFASFFLILYNVLFFYGLQVGFAGLGGVIVTGSNPIFTFILVAYLDKLTIPKIQKVALILGIIGDIITVDIFHLAYKDLIQGGNLIFLVASLCWSLVTIFSTKAKEYINSLLFSVYLYITSSIILFLFFVPNGALVNIFSYDMVFWFNLFFTMVISTGFATTIYFYASNILGAHKTSSFIFVVPFVAVISSALFLKEIPQLSTIIGGAILIYAIWLINKKPKLTNLTFAPKTK